MCACFFIFFSVTHVAKQKETDSLELESQEIMSSEIWSLGTNTEEAELWKGTKNPVAEPPVAPYHSF